MPIYLVFLSVVAIWSTTPLAIQWSTLGSDFNFAVASRMLIGLAICLLLLLIKQQKLLFFSEYSFWHYLGSIWSYANYYRRICFIIT
jgi:hypothetical protein